MSTTARPAADVPGAEAADARPRERPTMKDVAALAGVSLKTVSRVVSDVPTVAPELAEKVRAAADKLGYRPNLTASHLRRSDRRTNSVGLLLEDVSNPFSAAVHRAVEDFFRGQHVLVLAGSLDGDPARERELTRRLIDRRVDGLIVMPADGDHRYVISEQLAGTAFVFIDREPSPLLADTVVSDNLPAARAAVQHLLQHGRRRIAFLGDDLSVATAAARFAGYREALTHAGIGLDESLVRHGLRNAEQARTAAASLLDDVGSPGAPDAIFASQNLVTVGAIEALHHAGVQHQVALVGFDDVPLGALLRPGVTVMAQQPGEIGRLAAERLAARLAGDRSAPRVYTVPSRLVVRGSGELPA
ncbi:MAG: LacI family DNA-binding transcriptional regulator [Actinomycetes bacterium]